MEIIAHTRSSVSFTPCIAMAQLNLDRSVEDPFYRYKMAQLETKKEGRGNGTKTILTNLETVAKDIGTPAETLLGFIRLNLGVQGKAKQGRYVITGWHSPSDLQDNIYAFIEKFVLCTLCRNPETKLSCTTSKASKLFMSCKACGGRSEVNHTHKIMSTLKKIYAAAPPSKPTNVACHYEETWEPEFEINCTEKPVLAMSTSERLDELQSIAQESNYSASVVMQHANRLQCLDSASAILLNAWNPQTPVKSVKEHTDVHQQLLKGNKSGQKAFLKAMERFFLEYQSVPQKQMSLLLLHLYQNDLIEEESFLAWRVGKATRKMPGGPEFKPKLLCLVEPFMQWLRTAESESDASDQEQPTNLEEAAQPIDVDDSFIDAI